MTSSSRLAVITGGNRGTGRATAVALGRDGTDVIVTYRNHSTEAEAAVWEIEAAGVRAVALPLDLGDLKSFDGFASSLRTALHDTWARESFDYLINNGGSQRPGSFLDVSEEDFDGLVDVMFKGVLFLSQKLAPLLRDGGSIINISSGVTRFYTPQHFVHAACKGAVEVLTRYMAQELGPRRITVNTVAPGATATDFMGGFLRGSPETQARVSSATALGRPGQPDDIALGIAQVLQRNGESTAQMLAVAERLGGDLGLSTTIIPGWGELQLLAEKAGRRVLTVGAAEPTGIHMAHVVQARRAIDEVGSGRLALAAVQALRVIAQLPPAPTWLFTLAAAAGAAALSVIFGVQHLSSVALIAASAALGALLRRIVARYNANALLQPFCASLVAGLIGAVAVRLDLSTSLRLIAVCPCRSWCPVRTS